jgi:8-hydroxy-5-deazaflavin:NADPH oxidoreductase
VEFRHENGRAILIASSGDVEAYLKIGIIGAGQIGGTLTRLFSRAGHEVSVANSRGPQTLADLAAETGAKAVTAHEAARAGAVVIVTIQQGRVHELPKDLFEGVPDTVVIVDTNNYYPRERDGRIDGIEEGLLESRWVEQQLGRSVVKAFNNINWVPLLNNGKAKGANERIALPVAGDDAKAKAVVISLIDEIGFDGVDAGPLNESWRQQPDTPVYGTNLDAERLKQALQRASPERKPKWRATSNSPGNFEIPA